VFYLGLVGEGHSDAGGWHLVVIAVVVGFGSSGEDGEVVRFASDVFDSVCPKLSFVVVSDAVVGYKSGVGEVEGPRWGGEEANAEGGGKVCCKRE
jgi:hypothetical protein